MFFRISHNVAAGVAAFGRTVDTTTFTVVVRCSDVSIKDFVVDPEYIIPAVAPTGDGRLILDGTLIFNSYSDKTVCPMTYTLQEQPSGGGAFTTKAVAVWDFYKWDNMNKLTITDMKIGRVNIQMIINNPSRTATTRTFDLYVRCSLIVLTTFPSSYTFVVPASLPATSLVVDGSVVATSTSHKASTACPMTFTLYDVSSGSPVLWNNALNPRLVDFSSPLVRVQYLSLGTKTFVFKFENNDPSRTITN